MVLPLTDYSLFKGSDILGKSLDLSELHGVGRRVGTGSRLQTGPVEPVHAGKDVKLLAEQCFEALFTLVTRIDFNAPIFDHSELIFELFCISGVAVHKLFESPDLSRVALQALANLIFEVFNFDILIEVGQKILNFDNFAIFCQLNHIADSAFLHQEVLCDLYP